jgi:hypothetical protein
MSRKKAQQGTPNVETTTAKKRDNRTKEQAQGIIAQTVGALICTPTSDTRQRGEQATQLQETMEARFGIEHDENRRKHEQRADEMQK